MTNLTTCRTGLFLAAIGVAALGGWTTLAAAPAAVDTAKEAANVRSWVAQYNADYKARAIDKLLADSEPTVMGYVPMSPVVNGPGDAKSMGAEFAADPALSITLNVDRAEVSKSGDLGYVIGSFSRTATNPATHAVETGGGGYVLVVRKQADGNWKLIAYSASQGPAAAPAKP
ncbi:MAG: YybH family protein [Caulobacterales bacterium]